MVSRINDLKRRVKDIVAISSTPRKIAVGGAIAIFWNFIPSLGIGPFLTLFAAKILKANVVAAITLNLGTSFFIPLFYTMNVITGRIVMGSGEISGEKAQDYKVESGGFSIGRLKEVFQNPEEMLGLMQGFSIDFVIGSVINAFLASIFLYFIFLYILNKRVSMRNKGEKIS